MSEQGMKRLLMIVPFFPPMAGGGVYRPLSFVKYLPEFGWQTTVVAPRGDAFWIRDERLVDQIPTSCEVIRTNTLSGQALLSRRRDKRPPQKRSSSRYSAARRLASFFLVPDSYAGWRPFAVNAAMAAVERNRFDALYSTSPPESSHLAAMAVQRRTGLPWVADFRDPWMNLYLLRPPTPFHAAWHRRLERRVCARAHAVVTTKWHESQMKQTYPDAVGVTRISNGYDAAEAASAASGKPPGDRFRITHAGMLTQHRTALPFLHGLRHLFAEHPEIRAGIEVLFVGAREDRNEEAAMSLGLGDVVQFRDTLPHEETLQLERSSHILLLIKHVNPDYSGMVPGKLYEYFGARRPVLAIAPAGEAAQLVRDLNRGVVVAQDEERALSAALAELYRDFENGSLERRFDLSPRPEFSREVLAGRLASLLDDISAAGAIP
jgi:glycosyltransferase involved in cell wall biosynthesis